MEKISCKSHKNMLLCIPHYLGFRWRSTQFIFLKILIQILATSAAHTQETIDRCVQLILQFYWKMIEQIHLNRKNILPALEFEPTNFRLENSCHCITCHWGICIVSLSLLVSSIKYSGTPSRGYYSLYSGHQQHFSEPGDPKALVCHCFTYSHDLL